MVKIFIDPGHGGKDPGAVGNGLQEKELTLQISLKIRDILLSEYDNISVKLSRTKDETVSLAQRTKTANDWNADYFVSVHINAGGGSGFESFVYRKVPERTITYQKSVHENIVKQITLADRGMKQADYHVLRESAMDAILTENGFIDHPHDSAQLKDGNFIERLAQGHAEGIAEAFQLPRKGNASPEEIKADTELFIVQIGVFKDKVNADNAIQKAQENGFDTYVKKEDSLYKVQIGAFQSRARADELVQKAQNAGLNAAIIKK